MLSVIPSKSGELVEGSGERAEGNRNGRSLSQKQAAIRPCCLSFPSKPGELAEESGEPIEGPRGPARSPPEFLESPSELEGVSSRLVGF